MSAVGSAFNAVKGKVFGGDTHAVNSSNYTDMSQEEKDRLDDVEKQLNDLFGNQSKIEEASRSPEIQRLFADNLKQFLVTGGQQTPEDLKRASDFVDQTFTNPTQQVVDQNVADYQAQAQGRAAALGRNPNADIATQQAIAGEGLRQNIGLQAERGSRIQQASQDNYTRNLGSLNAGMQGSGYLNGLAQQAFSNQLSLLNGKTGLAQYYQQDRSQKPVGTTSSPGLLGYTGQIQNFVGNSAKAAGSLATLMG